MKFENMAALHALCTPRNSIVGNISDTTEQRIASGLFDMRNSALDFNVSVHGTIPARAVRYRPDGLTGGSKRPQQNIFDSQDPRQTLSGNILCEGTITQGESNSTVNLLGCRYVSKEQARNAQGEEHESKPHKNQ